MVHLNPLNPNTDGCPILARFTDLCKNELSLDENITKEAMNALNESKYLLSNFSTFGSEQEVESCWFAFILYSVKKLSECDTDVVKPTSNENRITLSQLLRVTKLNIVVFLKELPQLTVRFGTILSNLYGSDWEKRLEAKELQTNFVQLCVLSKHYRDAFQEFFSTNDVNSGRQSHASGSTGYISEYHQFGWLLFLALRIHAFSRFKDLVTCINGLVSVLAILIIHVPIHLRKFAIDDAQCFVNKGGKGVDLVASLSKKYNTSEDELMKTMEKVNNIILNILGKTPCVASECKTGNLDSINPDGLIYFTDLMEESSLFSSIDILERNCDESFNDMGDLDERIFAYESSLIGSGSLSGGVKRKFDCIGSPTKTITSEANDSKPKMIPTPVSTAMTTEKWLRTVISSLPSKPSPALEKFLSSCDRDVNSDVIRTAAVVLEAIFPCDALQNANRIDNVWAEERRMEALKLYYRVLESMCGAESEKNLGEKCLTPLLSNERFHRCMLACSAELVLATHKAVTMLFPAVLERSGVTAFDFSKVIESFIRHEQSLPRELRRHLNSLEERLLESMVWEKGSSMFNSLIVAKPAVSAEIFRLGLLADPMLPLDRTASPGGELLTPKKACSNTGNAYTSPPNRNAYTFATPTRPNPDGRGGTCAETEISIFFSKIVKLAAVRINGMVERLQSSQQTRDYVYSLVVRILEKRTSLFFNRHIDQIILCCFYGDAKISQSSLTFKEIIFNYRKQPHCKPHVFRDVFVDWSCNEKSGRVSVDIITFYNHIFIPAVKCLLQKSIGDTNTNGRCSESPKVSKFPTLPDMSPKKVSAVHNVYVSPLRSSKRDALITQTSKSYYACVGESTHAYESPSKDLTTINKQLNNKQPNGVRKVRGLLNFDEEGGLVSDSFVVNKSVYAQND